MLATNRNVLETTVGKTYFGQENVSRKMTMLASTATRLSAEILKTLGEIMNAEHPKLVASTNFGETYNSVFNGDRRIIRDFVKLH